MFHGDKIWVAKLNKKVIGATSDFFNFCPSNASSPLKNVEIRDIVEVFQKNFFFSDKYLT